MSLAVLWQQLRPPWTSRCLCPLVQVKSLLACLFRFRAQALLRQRLALPAELKDALAVAHCTRLAVSPKPRLILGTLQRQAAAHLLRPVCLKCTRAKAPGSSTWLCSGKRGSSPGRRLLFCVICTGRDLTAERLCVKTTLSHLTLSSGSKRHFFLWNALRWPFSCKVLTLTKLTVRVHARAPVAGSKAKWDV